MTISTLISSHSELMEYVQACKRCGTSPGEVVIDVSEQKDRFLDHIGVVYAGMIRQYVRCECCGFIYRTCILNEQGKRLLYTRNREKALTKEDQFEHFNRITSIPNHLSENYQKCVFLEKYIGRKRGTLLDVGCAGGAFLYTFRKYYPDWVVRGVDPVPNFAEAARLNNIEIHHGYLLHDTFDHMFEMVSAHNVLEHIQNVPEMMQLLHKYVKKSGLLYIEVPSDKDIGHLSLDNGRFMAQHDVIFTKEVLQEEAVAANFQPVVCDEVLTIRNRYNIRLLATPVKN